MKKNVYLVILALIAVIVGCGTSGNQPTENTVIDEQQNLPGDSTLYGLACDGCTDTIVVFLPYSGGDPDTFNILNASRQHMVFGHPQIGDRMALVRSQQDSCVADLVIDIDQLTGQWCYQVTPRLRERADIDNETRQRLLATIPDSVMKKLLQPHEQGFTLNGDGTVRPIGMTRRATSSDEQSPVEYPSQKLYREWHILNGQLLLNETRHDSLGNTQVVSSDTALLVLLRRDSLVLRIGNTEQGYYRVREEK